MQSVIAKNQSQSRSAPVMEDVADKVRRHPTWSVGDVAHQGDIIIVAIQAVPVGATKRKSRQLAEGDTRGSKHVLAGGKIFDADPAILAKAVADATQGRVIVQPQYIGPVIAGACVIEHPEHQHQAFPEHKASVICYQRNVDAEGREQRAAD